MLKTLYDILDKPIVLLRKRVELLSPTIAYARGPTVMS